MPGLFRIVALTALVGLPRVCVGAGSESGQAGVVTPCP